LELLFVGGNDLKIQTKGADGQANGYLVPLWNVHEHDWAPDQVYLTVVAPGCTKGPHLHKKRHGRFFCIKGNVEIIERLYDFGEHPARWSSYVSTLTGEDHDYAMVEVPPCMAAAIVNHGDTPALVLNMPTPAWTADDPDEWPVEDWNPPDVKHD
jgi:dTDP-4-dehydrorhamnose 3,5-epimerase-like enzyme